MTGPLEGVDGPRRMPAELRRRLEEELLAGAALPEDSRTRLTQRLEDPTAALLEGVDGPRPMPAGLRSRVERGLARPSRRRLRVAAWPSLVAAAVLIVILSSITVVVTDRAADDVATPTAGNAEAVDTQADSSDGAVAGAGGAAVVGALPPFATTRFSSQDSFLRGGADARTDSGSFKDAGGGTSGAGASAPPPAAPPFRISLREGDAVALAGFKAYVDVLNRNGGVRARRFELVGPSKAADTVVNLSGQPFGNPPQTPALDDLLAADSALRDDVFSFAGAVERQGRLIADFVFPAGSQASAVIYRSPDGPLGTTVPEAIESVLRSRGVSTTSVVVRPGRAVPIRRADAVFLSLDAGQARRVTDAYGDAPRLGFNGVGTVADTIGLPDGLRVVSPYDLPVNNETAALTEAAKRPLSARLVHGWVAAKTLAMAVWQYNPATSTDVRASLQAMASFDNGFAPPRQARPGTNSLRPDGIVLQLQAGHFGRLTDFLTDPR